MARHSFRLRIGLNGREGKTVVRVDEFERHAGRGGSRAMLDVEDDPIVAIVAQVEVGIAPSVEFRRSVQDLGGADGADPFPGMADESDGGRCNSRRKASNGATSLLTFSSKRCRRANGSPAPHEFVSKRRSSPDCSARVNLTTIAPHRWAFARGQRNLTIGPGTHNYLPAAKL